MYIYIYIFIQDLSSLLRCAASISAPWERAKPKQIKSAFCTALHGGPGPRRVSLHASGWWPLSDCGSRADNMLVSLVLLMICSTNTIKIVLWMQFLPKFRYLGLGLQDAGGHCQTAAAISCICVFVLFCYILPTQIEKKTLPESIFFSISDALC